MSTFYLIAKHFYFILRAIKIWKTGETRGFTIIDHGRVLLIVVIMTVTRQRSRMKCYCMKRKSKMKPGTEVGQGSTSNNH